MPSTHRLPSAPSSAARRTRPSTCLLLALAALCLGGCATSPTGRSQFIAVSDQQMDQLGATSFEQMKQSDKLSRNARKLGTARCVVDALKLALPPDGQRVAWEVQVFDDVNPNAFALPGGKMGVNTGMWTVAKTQDELAAVMAHELAHVLSRHAAERVSQQMAAGVALEAAQAYSGSRTSPENTRLLMGALGLGAQLGVMLPARNRSRRARPADHGRGRLRSRRRGAAVAGDDQCKRRWARAADPLDAPRSAEPHRRAAGPRAGAAAGGRAGPGERAQAGVQDVATESSRDPRMGGRLRWSGEGWCCACSSP